MSHDAAAPITSPADDGTKLATIGRAGGRELRIRYREYKGHHFIDIREWSLNTETESWWPTKGKGVTIKTREVGEVLKALQHAQNLVADA